MGINRDKGTCMSEQTPRSHYCHRFSSYTIIKSYYKEQQLTHTVSPGLSCIVLCSTGTRIWHSWHSLKAFLMRSSPFIFCHCLQDLLVTFVQAVMFCQKTHATLLSFHEIWVRQGEVPGKKKIKMMYYKEMRQIALLITVFATTVTFDPCIHCFVCSKLFLLAFQDSSDSWLRVWL